jgi:hypothetical protein
MMRPLLLGASEYYLLVVLSHARVGNTSSVFRVICGHGVTTIVMGSDKLTTLDFTDHRLPGTRYWGVRPVLVRTT